MARRFNLPALLALPHAAMAKTLSHGPLPHAPNTRAM